MLEIINDDFKNCCCHPVKCSLPDVISVEISGFHGTWGHGGSVHWNPTSNCIDCSELDGNSQAEVSGQVMERIGCFCGATFDYWPRNPVDGTAICNQNPQWEAYFPWLSGQPDTTTNVVIHAYENTGEGCSFYDTTPELFLGGALEPDCDTSVELPDCMWRINNKSPGAQNRTHRTQLHAYDLNNIFYLQRLSGYPPPVLETQITRSGDAPDQPIDAQLLFDLYEQAPPSQNQIESGVEPWFNVRYAVDYRCEPRSFFEPNNIYLYLCNAPQGIVFPKLRVYRGSGSSSAELEAILEPVAGSGSGGRDLLWQVKSAKIVSEGSGAQVNDSFFVDFYENPLRGGEYRDSQTPQQIRVTEVGPGGGVRGLELLKQAYQQNNTTIQKLVYYGRVLCHSNGVALPGNGYQEGDEIVWVCNSKHPDNFGGECITYQTARAYVSEVNEDGGIMDWWMGNAEHYAGCSNSNVQGGWGGSRGLYSDVQMVGRCEMNWAGFAPVRCAFVSVADSLTVCNASPGLPQKCDIQFISPKFSINAVPTELNIDISPPSRAGRLKAQDGAAISISPAEGNSSPPVTATPIPKQGDFASAGPDISVEQGGNVSVDGIELKYLGSQWPVVVSISVTHGVLSDNFPKASGARSVTFTGTVEEVRQQIEVLRYKPDAGIHGVDALDVTVEVTPPGYDNPRTAKAIVSALVDNDSEDWLNYFLYEMGFGTLPFRYPEARQLGGIASVYVDPANGCYASWDSDAKQWVKDPDAQIALRSAWDDVRAAILFQFAINTYAQLRLVVDTNVESGNFGQIVAVAVDYPGFFYILHEWDQMFYARASWDFIVGWPEYAEDFGGIINATANLTHKNGYIFGPTWNGPVKNPNLGICEDSTEDDYSTLCPSGDKTEVCKLAPDNYLWSFEYCPNDLLKSFDMLIDMNAIFFPNTPDYKDCCFGDNREDNPEFICWGCGWCDKPGDSKYGVYSYWEDAPELGDGMSVNRLEFSNTIIETFGNGPITFTFQSEDINHRREEDIN